MSDRLTTGKRIVHNRQMCGSQGEFERSGLPGRDRSARSIELPMELAPLLADHRPIGAFEAGAQLDCLDGVALRKLAHGEQHARRK
jgi:hypothetical protein